MNTALSTARVLITGASSPIGRAISLRLANRGARLFLLSRQSPEEVPLVSQLPPRGEGQFGHVQLVGDVAFDLWGNLQNLIKEELELEVAKDEVEMEEIEGGMEGDVEAEVKVDEKVNSNDSGEKKKAPHINVLINAAGITHRSLLVRTSTKDIEKVIQTNLIGSIMATKAMLPHMLREKDGCIINIASIAAMGLKGSSVYAASKAGLLGLQRSLVQEYAGKGVRFNTVLPGYVEGGMTKDMKEPEKVPLRKSIPMKRFATPDEIASVVGEMVENKFMNGAEVVVDGGMSWMRAMLST